MRWQVGISGFKCELELIEQVFERLGYKIVENEEIYYLNSDKFETCSDHNAVWEEANKLKNSIQNLLVLIPIKNIAFNLEHILETQEDGSSQKHCFAAVVMSASTVLTLNGHALTIGTPEEIEKQRIKREEQEKREKVRETVKLIATSSKYDQVQLVLDLLKGQLTPLITGHIFDLIEDDIGSDIKLLSNKTKIRRFTRSINHPDIFGVEARHIVSRQPPPPDPMNLEEAKEFIKELVNKWVEQKFEKTEYYFV